MSKLALYLFLFSVLIVSCNNNKDKKEPDELLIYCGITMIKPISEISKIIEKQENCKILITKGGSGNLFKSILTNEAGDLYLPGSETYIEKAIKENFVTDTVFVGINKAVMMVQKNNPKKIKNCLSSLTDKKLRIVIGNPYSGSIGKETKKILDKKGIFEEVNKNIEYYTTDSKDLTLALKNDKADLVVNWYATSTWEGNKKYIDVFVIDEKFAKKKKLIIGLLKYSNNPEIAKKFIKYASSKEGQEIFKKHGLY